MSSAQETTPPARRLVDLNNAFPLRNSNTPPHIADYELLRWIGGGSYGEVWLARSVLGDYRAVKIVYRRNFEHERPYEREFEGIRKYEPISRTHESQVDILHVGRNDSEGYFYYVMELADDVNAECETRSAELSAAEVILVPRSAFRDPSSYSPRTLKSELDRRGRLPFDECLKVGLALTKALDHLHASGLVHRDVKPSNIIFIGGVPKLADIGLVAAAGEARSVVGTEGYLDPAAPGTPQADLYSLGRVLYEISMGRKGQSFPDLPPDWEEIPDQEKLLELNEVILKACQGDLRIRYQSAKEMRAELELLQRGQSVQQKRSGEQRWAAAKKAGLVVVMLALVGIGAKFALTDLTRKRPLSSNPEAENLYRQSVYLLQSMTLEQTREAYTNLTEAVKLDPQFVEAYYALFEAYYAYIGPSLPPHFNQLKNINWVAEKLKSLRPNSAQYHTVNSLISFKEWKFDEAIEEVRLAIKIDPTFFGAHVLYAWYMLHARGDATIALREYRAAARIDPSALISQYLIGTAFYLDRKFDRAIEQYSKALRLEPRQSLAHFCLGRAYEANGQYAKAIDEYELDTLNQTDASAEKVKIKARYDAQRAILRDQGPRGWWQAKLDEARPTPSPNPYHTATLCARLGYADEVFQLLDRAYKEHTHDMIELLEDDCWDPLRKDPRFQDIIKRMGLGQK